MTSPEQYEQALKVIKAYREERNMEFYLPINLSFEGKISLEEFRRFISLQKELGL